VINAEIRLIKTKKNVGVNFYLQCSSGHVSLEEVPVVQNKSNPFCFANLFHSMKTATLKR
jgi:hypothetical protein